MAPSSVVVFLSVLAVARLEDQWYPTDQSRLDQLDEINSFLQYYTEFLRDEINNYERLSVVDKELRPYIDAVTVVQKLVTHSWVRNMKPDDRYSVPSDILERQQAIDDLAEEIKEIDRKTPVPDAILLFHKVNTVSTLNDKKEAILFGLASLKKSIDKAKRAQDFDTANTLKAWGSKLSNQLESIENDIKQAAIIKEMILQSYILIFEPRHDGKTVTIKHSNGLMENQRDFPVPPLETLSVLQEINENFK